MPQQGDTPLPRKSLPKKGLPSIDPCGSCGRAPEENTDPQGSIFSLGCMCGAGTFHHIVRSNNAQRLVEEWNRLAKIEKARVPEMVTT